MAALLLLRTSACAWLDAAAGDHGTALVPAIPDTSLPPFTESTDSIPDTSQALGNATPTDSAGASPLPRDTIPPDARTAEDDGTFVDSLVVDSLRREALLAASAARRDTHEKAPRGVDSLHDPFRISPYRLYAMDDMGVSELLHRHPFFIPIAFTLSSQLNRVLYYGFPASHVSIRHNRSLFRDFADGTKGSDQLSAGEMQNLRIGPSGRLLYAPHPLQLPRPETLLLFESGVFDEYLLNIRFARPLSETLQIGAFSNFRNLPRTEYSHSTGGIYSFYKSIYDRAGIDTSYISHTGINPKTDEHVFRIDILNKASNGVETRVSYRYSGTHNDLAWNYEDSTKTPSLEWLLQSRYEHGISLDLHGLHKGVMGMDFQALLHKSSLRLDPVSAGVTSLPSGRGNNVTYGVAARPHIMFAGSDTVSVILKTSRSRTVKYNSSTNTVHVTSAEALSDLGLHGDRASALIHGAAGYGFIKLNDSLEAYPKWEISITGLLAGQKLRMYALQDAMPPIVPFESDSILLVYPGYLLDRYLSAGTDIFLHHKVVGLSAGACMMLGVEDRSVRIAWPGGVPPYPQPRWSFSLAPVIGPFAGFSLSSAWTLSNREPFTRSRTTISFLARPERGVKCVAIDLGFDYWSRRERIVFGGTDLWNRVIYDLHLKTTLQIKTFRLFYKVDNIFNRKIAYVPGYYMPGLVFRWGFNWLLQG